MQSLRTRKPSDGGPNTLRKPSMRRGGARGQISGPVQQDDAEGGVRKGSIGGTASSGTTRDMRKSRLDDKIKKRMSMRYADGPRMPDSIPDMPSLPLAAHDGGRRERDRERVMLQDPNRISAAETLDLQIFGAENFDPDGFLKTKLGNSTEYELRSLQSTLQSSKEATAADLQRNVFKNYAEFMLISKEISTLENDMLDLKENLSEWKNMPELLKMDEATSTTPGGTIDRRRTFRSSVADLKTLYASQMQTLHTLIEGSAKFVPAVAGRHIIIETGDMVALNTATYKVEYPVHFVLLDDQLLVARRRKQRATADDEASGKKPRGKLVAEKCWLLNEIVIVDVKDTTDLHNLIKVRHAKEVHVYRCARPSDKKNLLLNFRQVAEELAARRRKEREGENERRKSIWTGSAPKNSGPDEPMPNLPPWLADMAQANGAVVGDSRGAPDRARSDEDVRWMDDFCDKLTVAVAMREWDEAARLVDEGKARSTKMPSLTPRLTQLTDSLISALLHALGATGNSALMRKSTVVHLAALLQRLGSTPAAVNAFLAARTEMTRRRVRSIAMEGDVVSYVSDLCVVVFCGIKHTADWFLASWREHEVASLFVQWAREQIEAFAIMFRKQVYGTDTSRQIMVEALTLVRQQNKKFLQDNGVDFSFLLEDLLTPPSAPDAAKAHIRAGSLGGSKTFILPAPPELMPSTGPKQSVFRSTASGAVSRSASPMLSAVAKDDRETERREQERREKEQAREAQKEKEREAEKERKRQLALEEEEERQRQRKLAEDSAREQSRAAEEERVAREREAQAAWDRERRMEREKKKEREKQQEQEKEKERLRELELQRERERERLREEREREAVQLREREERERERERELEREREEREREEQEDEMEREELRRQAREMERQLQRERDGTRQRSQSRPRYGGTGDYNSNRDPGGYGDYNNRDTNGSREFNSGREGDYGSGQDGSRDYGSSRDYTSSRDYGGSREYSSSRATPPVSTYSNDGDRYGHRASPSLSSSGRRPLNISTNGGQRSDSLTSNGQASPTYSQFSLPDPGLRPGTPGRSPLPPRSPAPSNSNYALAGQRSPMPPRSPAPPRSPNPPRSPAPQQVTRSRSRAGSESGGEEAYGSSSWRPPRPRDADMPGMSSTGRRTPVGESSGRRTPMSGETSLPPVSTRRPPVRQAGSGSYGVPLPPGSTIVRPPSSNSSGAPNLSRGGTVAKREGMI